MKSKLFVAVALTLVLITAAAVCYATSQTATCPQDGETAYATGNKNAIEGSGFPPSYSCEYSHIYGGGPHGNETHTFWAACGK